MPGRARSYPPWPITPAPPGVVGRSQVKSSVPTAATPTRRANPDAVPTHDSTEYTRRAWRLGRVAMSRVARVACHRDEAREWTRTHAHRTLHMYAVRRQVDDPRCSCPGRWHALADWLRSAGSRSRMPLGVSAAAPPPPAAASGAVAGARSPAHATPRRGECAIFTCCILRAASRAVGLDAPAIANEGAWGRGAKGPRPVATARGYPAG